MRWDLVHDGNSDWSYMRHLYEMRRTMRALSKGDLVFLRANQLIAFLRTTDRAQETVLVLANMEDTVVTETISMRDGRIMAGTDFRDALSYDGHDAMQVNVQMGFMTVTMPPRSARILKIVPPRAGVHSPYKRMN
jgi:hypothetical protein